MRSGWKPEPLRSAVFASGATDPAQAQLTAHTVSCHRWLPGAEPPPRRRLGIAENAPKFIDREPVQSTGPGSGSPSSPKLRQGGESLADSNAPHKRDERGKETLRRTEVTRGVGGHNRMLILIVAIAAALVITFMLWPRQSGPQQQPSMRAPVRPITTYHALHSSNEAPVGHGLRTADL